LRENGPAQAQDLDGLAVGEAVGLDRAKRCGDAIFAAIRPKAIMPGLTN